LLIFEMADPGAASQGLGLGLGRAAGPKSADTDGEADPIEMAMEMDVPRDQLRSEAGLHRPEAGLKG